MGKSTLSHTAALLLKVMRFTKLNKCPLSIKPPPSKVIGENKPPRGLDGGFMVIQIIA